MIITTKNSYSQNIQIIKIIEPDSSFFKFKLLLEKEKYYYGVTEKRLFNASYKLLQHDKLKELIKSYQQLTTADSLLIGALNNKNNFLEKDNQEKETQIIKLNTIIDTKQKTNTKVITTGSIIIAFLTSLIIIK